ncbi:MAG: hypothetical protein AAB373_06020 [Patescibacteria group bacterium]
MKKLLKNKDLPLPPSCPSCRMQRRFAWRNERNLYYRKCDLSGKQIISIYQANSPYKVYEQHEWYGDKWEALDYGRDFDFNRPFFEQFKELMLDVPKISVFASRNENSDYTNGAQQNKNSYMIFVSDHNEDCYYSYAIDSCKDCLECFNCYKSTLCVECIDCSDCYHVAYSQNSHNCSESYFLYDCKNCQNCFGCYGLRSKKYHIFNQPHSKEEYEKKVKSLNLGNRQKLQEVMKFVEHKAKQQQIRQYYDGNNNDHSTGDHIVGCKSCTECYDSGELEDCGYLIYSFKSKDCFDGHVVVDKCELCYETLGTINQYDTQFTFMSFYSKNSMYLDHCVGVEDCFGCSGLKKKQYCIFNKQYTKEEYFELRNKIIEHMKQTGEWGSPPGIELSPFAYNETVAQDYFPLSKGDVLAQGWVWFEEDENESAYQGTVYELPSGIEDVPDDIGEKILKCEKSGKLYKIIPQELRLYRFHNLPLPTKCFKERHLDRVANRNPRQLCKRACMQCGIEVASSYTPERKEIIYCEKCYLAEVA